MKEKQHIEELFKSKLEGLEISPSEDLWKKTSRSLKRRQFLRFRPGRLNIYYTAGLFILGTALTLLLLNPKDFENSGYKNITDVHEAGSENNIDSPKGSTSANDSQAVVIQEGNANNTLSESGKTQNGQKKIQNNTARNSGEKYTSSAGPNTPTFSEEKDPQKEDADAKSLKQVSTLFAYFTPDVYEGCAPLTVKFVNASLNASSCLWNFGSTTKTSQLYSPTVTFDEPGTYIVTLISSDEKGLQQSYSEQISVYPRPEAVFEIEDTHVYNYSVGASEYSWGLELHEGDKSIRKAGQLSTLFQPDLEELCQQMSRATHLQLVARNSFACTDTASLAIPGNSQPGLHFPNAFSPNSNGSTGGYYSLNEPNTEVFFPKYTEKPADYLLQIFNKTGELIFTSQDIQIGWDGYYKEAPAALGVYIYQCTGSWKNGEPFNYRGDITILWNQE